MSTDLKKLFESWGKTAKREYVDQQWLLSKWEVVEGIVWPQEKINLMTQTIVDGLQLQKSDSLVDIGCGGGWILKQLKPYVNRIVGLDFSQSMLANARQFCPQDDLVCGEIGRLPFGDEVFDHGLSYFVFLNFLDDDFVERGLLDALKTIKKGGKLLVGQLPDKSKSKLYDHAKGEYLKYCEKRFRLGESHRDVCRAPQKLFDLDKLRGFLEREKIDHEFRRSFNPFFRPGVEPTVEWRFDLVLKK
ncbi:MAG: class I SAM-dependent methyltransferase [Candidatus Omnitrophica bacterium]|nr:class I SAM-dependent methyltransferase [Candidatus Omnitrophota bacterium]